jgi:DNA polymerase I-like protein with 3'-5' exonuclease and polymerase domains
MSNEFLQVLVEMEIHGVAIDQDALDAVEDAYKERHTQLDRSLHERVHQVMGDVPVNLNSPDFCSELFYSRRVVNKRKWKELFNIGTDSRGKALRPPLLNPHQFTKVVRANTTILKVPKVETCKVCRGVGSIDKLTIQGVPYKIPPKCAKCGGAGVLLIPTSVTAGLRLSPMSTIDTSAAGFRANKTALLKLRDTAKNDFVRSFIDDFIELSAISTYLSTFVNGINKFKHDNILHTNLNQTITSTGRLSSSSPNLQNMPRGFTFPVKKCFVSRFEDGSIIEADYSGLEFRMAGHLSGCPSVRRYVDEGTDPHTFTRDFINNFDSNLPSITRQEAKADTFKPLYGGSSGSPRQRAYYAGFLKEHHGVADWHEALKKEAIKTKMVRLPTGREYVFPYATRLPNRYVNQTTQIVNYPVQGFATGDVVPCGIIATDRLFKQRGLRSLLILTVHDSIYVDTYPGEEEEVVECLNIGMLGIDEMFQEFYGINMSFPLAIEIKEGPNAFEMKEVN